MKSFIPHEKDIQKHWHIIDAEGQILGRLASRTARLLIGKDKPIYTPFIDTGDHVIIINAGKVTEKISHYHKYGISRRIAGDGGGSSYIKRSGEVGAGGCDRHASQIEAGTGDEEKA
jgi:hypothetical protein